MSINVSNLILILQQKIDSATNETDLLHYAKAIQQLRTGNIFTVHNVSELPNAAQNPGLLYYVISDELVYFATTLFGWLEIYKTSINRIFSWGGGVRGALGDGTTVAKCSPVREVCSATDWCQVSSASSSTAAIKTSGELWAWGDGCFGRLGDGTTVSSCSPVREICSATDWCSAGLGVLHTAAIKTSGELWVWGYNSCGRLGDGTVTNRCSPVRERCSATDWCGVCAGSGHTAAVKTSGQIWTWGCNYYGTLGDGTVTSRCSPVRERCSATDWCQVSAGLRHTAAIKTTGQIWSWGSNRYGLLGDGTTAVCRISPVRERCSATDWCQVSAGGLHTAAIKTSGELWAWGYNRCNRLGDGTATNRCSPVREFCSATDWCVVSIGPTGLLTNGTTSAIKTTGQLWSWGSNDCGNLADGTTTNRCSPVREISSATDWYQVSASTYTTVAIKQQSF